MEKRVAIIGAGLSGLLACKSIIEKGYKPIVFEEQDRIGGIWNQTIESTKLQNVKFAYQFSDFPWPSSVKELFPHNTQVVEYIESYAQHFGLLPYIEFNSKVDSIDYVGESHEEMESWDLWGGRGKPFGSNGKWNLKVQQTTDSTIKDYEVEFVILCIGRFSGVPNIPEFPQGHGPEVFDGKVFHSMDYSAMDNKTAAQLIRGKRVVVVGSQKSAVDTAAQIADANGIDIPCTMIQRTVHWMMPSTSVWGVGLGSLYCNRFAELMVHKPGESIMHSILATMLSPLKWGLSKFVESYCRWKLPLKKYGMIPKLSYFHDLSACEVFIQPDNFYDKVVKGSIILKKSESFSFVREGLILDGEHEPLKADVVILATGYRGDEKLKNVFKSSVFQEYMMGSQGSIIPLYRQIIHPRIPQLAVMGYSESFANLYTFELRSQWLKHFLDQTFQLPSIIEMEKEVMMWEKYMKLYAGNAFRRSCIGGVHIWYSDQICRDIGCNPRRKKGFFSELFQPYGPMDYAGLVPKSGIE